MAITYQNIKRRLGDLEANIGTGSELVISDAISGAQAFVDELTGASTGTIIDAAVSDIATAQVVNTFMGNDTITTQVNLVDFANNLQKQGMEKIKSKGIVIRKSVANP